MLNTDKDHCYHCGEANDSNQEFVTTVLGEPRHLCCPGCLAVTEAIVAGGLESYYQFRTEPGEKAEQQLQDTLSKLKMFDQPELQEEFVFDQGKHKQIQLTVEGISCAACGWLIEKQLAKHPGLVQVSVNVAARRALVSWDPQVTVLSEILNRLEQIGYHALPFQADQHEASYRSEQKSLLKKLGLAGLMTMQVMMLAFGLYFSLFGYIEDSTREFFHWISLVLTTPVVLYSGTTFYRGAYNALRAGSLNMDVPITIAVWGTYIAGVISTWLQSGEVYFESVCMFIFLLLISRYLEHRSRYQASQISANMMQFIPVSATVIDNGEFQSCLAKSLNPGQVILIKPGETVPVDGVIIDGQGQVDESMLTGEFEPVSKSNGDWVYGGTINQAGSLTVEVKKQLKHALVNQIVRLQEVAMAHKPHIAVLADKISRYFVAAVLLVAAVTFAYWTWQGNPDAFWITIAVLVATCPCALGLATPTALTCAMANLNRNGVLLKRSDALEAIPDIDSYIFDKTGTLTAGQFSIERQSIANGYQAEQLMQMAASLEARSEHAIARAFISPLALQQVSDFHAIPGKGISGVINGHEVKLGNQSFVQAKVPENWQDASVLMQLDNQIVAGYWLTDKIKDDVAHVIDWLPAEQITLLSGDNTANVEKLSNQLGIRRALAQQTPALKLDHIRQLHDQGRKVMMVGDGINDGPVLAAADVSIAVSNASDLAKQSADVILLGGKLGTLPTLIDMSRRTTRKIRQNMMWSISYNLLALPVAMAGVLSPWMAVIGMSLSSIIVVSNSARLLSTRSE